MSFCDFGITKRVDVHQVEGDREDGKVIITAIDVSLLDECTRLSVTDAEDLLCKLGALLANLKKHEEAGHLVLIR